MIEDSSLLTHAPSFPRDKTSTCVDNEREYYKTCKKEVVAPMLDCYPKLAADCRYCLSCRDSCPLIDPNPPPPTVTDPPVGGCVLVAVVPLPHLLFSL